MALIVFIILKVSAFNYSVLLVCLKLEPVFLVKFPADLPADPLRRSYSETSLDGRQVGGNFFLSMIKADYMDSHNLVSVNKFVTRHAPL